MISVQTLLLLRICIHALNINHVWYKSLLFYIIQYRNRQRQKYMAKFALNGDHADISAIINIIFINML